MPKIRVELPTHLRTLAGIKTYEVILDVAALQPPDAPSIAVVLDALEAAYPMLSGTIRDHATGERRAFLRFFACQQDVSLEPVDAPVPLAVAEGREPLIILGAVAGGIWKDQICEFH
jgi:sulfur-carrier protein